MILITPLFIVFEGIDGSGKTTLSRMLFDNLKSSSHDVVWFREPGDSKWGRKIRELAQLKDRIPIQEELAYFIEDRKMNVKKNIIPALKQKRVVILDRYFYSTACYQGARGLDMEAILKTNRAFAPEPDCTFIIDIDVQTALERIQRSRTKSARLFEKASFLTKVRENYLRLRGTHIHILEGNRLPQSIFKDIIQILDSDSYNSVKKTNI